MKINSQWQVILESDQKSYKYDPMSYPPVLIQESGHSHEISVICLPFITAETKEERYTLNPYLIIIKTDTNYAFKKQQTFYNSSFHATNISMRKLLTLFSSKKNFVWWVALFTIFLLNHLELK